jgi:hypothetical protein
LGGDALTVFKKVLLSLLGLSWGLSWGLGGTAALAVQPGQYTIRDDAYYAALEACQDLAFKGGRILDLAADGTLTLVLESETTGSWTYDEDLRELKLSLQPIDGPEIVYTLWVDTALNGGYGVIEKDVPEHLLRSKLENDQYLAYLAPLNELEPKVIGLDRLKEIDKT